MPELPEVETIKNQLQKLIIGKKIKAVKVFLPKIVKAFSAQFKKAVVDARIKKISRRAKILVIELDDGWSLLVHLKMTGQLIYQKNTPLGVIPARSDESETRRAKAGIQNSGSRVTRLARRACQPRRVRAGESRREPGMTKGKHTHIIFEFTDNSWLLFNDLRQFGYIKLIKTEDLVDFFIKEKTGPEPLEKFFLLADFKALLARRPKARIKQFLMDPKIIAGIGNIYADEILFFARVHPLRRAGFLEDNEIKKIYEGIRKILPEAIRLKGTSSNDYLDAYGRKGSFAKKLKVYSREGQKCVKCREEIKRIKIGGRSAHFCPACQRLEP